MYNKNSFFSKKLSLLYAVLTFLIVLQHSSPLGRFGLDIDDTDYPIIHCLRIFSYISVPLFFFMSSLLFYRSCEFIDLKRKLHSRIYSLLIPYFLWNLIFVFIYFLITRVPIIEEHMRMGKVLDNPYSIFIAVVDSRFTPLWFVRDLMCFCFFSPLILFIIKRLWLTLIVFVFSVSVTYFGDFSHQSVVTWVPVYLLGAVVGRYCSYKEYEDDGATFRFLIKSVKVRNVLSILLFVCFIVLYWLSINSDVYLYWFRLFSPLILWVFIDFVMYHYINDRFERKQWMSYTFFIYCTHYFVLNVMQKCMTLFLEPTYICLNIIFLVSPILVIIVLTLFANYLSKYTFYKYLSGKR